MAVILVVVLAGLGILLLMAHLSDRRDRRNGLDPKMRADALVTRRRDLRRKRVDMITRKARANPGIDRPDPKPWER